MEHKAGGANRIALPTQDTCAEEVKARDTRQHPCLPLFSLALSLCLCVSSEAGGEPLLPPGNRRLTLLPGKVIMFLLRRDTAGRDDGAEDRPCGSSGALPGQRAHAAQLHTLSATDPVRRRQGGA